MTKKSLGRQARDHAAKAQQIADKARDQERTKALAEIQSGNNTCWDDLNQIHAGCQQLLINHAHLGRELNQKDMIAEIEDPHALVLKIRSLAADLRQMTGELAEIYTQHQDKTGGVDDPDVLMTTFAIFEQYTLFKERHEAVVMPTVYHILEQVQLAEDRLNKKLLAAQQAAAATDPNVVTDVQYKEVPAEEATA